jgi:hypothetical protein
LERERRLDRLVRRICIASWSVTFILLLGYAVIVAIQVQHTMRLLDVGMASSLAVIGMVMPLVIVLGIMALLVATLSTVGMFLRFRTAALAEIQLRLAALEGMLGRE